MWERSIDQLPLIHTLTWCRDWTCIPGRCPDQVSNWWPFALQDDWCPISWATPGRVCTMVLHDPILFWLWRNGDTMDSAVNDEIEIKNLYSALVCKLWILALYWKFPKSLKIWNDFLNYPFIFIRQGLTCVLLAWFCPSHMSSPIGNWGLCGKGRMLIHFFWVCGTCSFVQDQASWLFVLEIQFPSILLNCNREFTLLSVVGNYFPFPTGLSQ